MPKRHEVDEHSLPIRLQRETGLDATTCGAALEILQRNGLAQRYVRLEEDALLVLRRVRSDPKHANSKQRAEAAKDGAVVLRARHCLRRGNRRECMNEIHDAFHTGILSIRTLLNATIDPALTTEERETVVLDMLGDIWLEGMRGGKLLHHILAYPDDLEPGESFCLATYAAARSSVSRRRLPRIRSRTAR